MGGICVFLLSEQILCFLIQKSENIEKINEHIIPIRRLLNPAKRIIISNVYPPINNQSILDALMLINISPLSEINFLKAGIKEIGYEHILSFRRRINIKYEDIPKLTGSLIININKTNFITFFTDDTITCYICKSKWVCLCPVIKTQQTVKISLSLSTIRIITLQPLPFEAQDPIFFREYSTSWKSIIFWRFFKNPNGLDRWNSVSST